LPPIVPDVCCLGDDAGLRMEQGGFEVMKLEVSEEEHPEAAEIDPVSAAAITLPPVRLDEVVDTSKGTFSKMVLAFSG